MGLGRLFLSFLRVGATGFGGPMALIGLLQQELVERQKAVSSEEFAEGVAIGQILPGPIAVDAAIHVGYRLKGWLGATAAAGGMVLPPFLIMLILTPLYFEFGRVPEAQGFFAGVRPAVVAVIAAAGWRMGKRGFAGVGSALIAAVVFAAMLFGANAILLVLLSGVLGLLFFRDPAGGEAPRPKAVEGNSAEEERPAEPAAAAQTQEGHG